MKTKTGLPPACACVNLKKALYNATNVGDPRLIRGAEIFVEDPEGLVLPEYAEIERLSLTSDGNLILYVNFKYWGKMRVSHLQHEGGALWYVAPRWFGHTQQKVKVKIFPHHQRKA